MKVKELIELLQKKDPEKIVHIRNDGCIGELQPEQIYEGRHYRHESLLIIEPE